MDALDDCYSNLGNEETVFIPLRYGSQGSVGLGDSTTFKDSKELMESYKDKIFIYPNLNQYDENISVLPNGDRVVLDKDKSGFTFDSKAGGQERHFDTQHKIREVKKMPNGGRLALQFFEGISNKGFADLYVDDGKILQTMLNRTSGIWPYRGPFKEYTTGIYRWKDLQN